MMRLGSRPRPGRRSLAVPVLASITAIAAAAAAVADAAQRRATLGVEVRVVGRCAVTTGGGAGVSVDTACVASARPATLIESGSRTAARAVATDAGGATPPLAGVVEADGVQYLTVIY